MAVPSVATWMIDHHLLCPFNVPCLVANRQVRSFVVAIRWQLAKAETTKQRRVYGMGMATLFSEAIARTCRNNEVITHASRPASDRGTRINTAPFFRREQATTDSPFFFYSSLSFSSIVSLPAGTDCSLLLRTRKTGSCLPFHLNFIALFDQCEFNH